MSLRILVLVLAILGFAFWNVDSRAAEKKKLPDLNDKVLKFAEASVGKQIGNGECWTLADEALADAGARRPGRDGWDVYVFGRELKADEAVLPGDIVQFSEARFETKGGGVAIIPQHTAVVAKREGTKFSILHQNWNKSTKVSKLDLDLADLKKGTVTFSARNRPRSDCGRSGQCAIRPAPLSGDRHARHTAGQPIQGSHQCVACSGGTLGRGHRTGGRQAFPGERTADAYGPPAEADGERQQRSRPALAGSTCRGLERMQEEINNMNSGAFTSIYQNPIVVALMLPLGGGGGLAALSFLLGH